MRTRPIRRLVDQRPNVPRIPAIKKIVLEVRAVGRVGNLIEQRLRRGRRSRIWRGIWDGTGRLPPRQTPVRALVRKLVRLVEMKRVNHVAVGQRLEPQQIANV